MMAKVNCLMDEHGASGLVILGDFNASPQSWTHLMLLEGWQACTTNRINMTDAFDNVMWNRDFCTSKTDARSEWIDYILYSGSTITPTGPAQVRKCPEQSMPSPEFPSDHMPLVFDFQFAEGHHLGFRWDLNSHGVRQALDPQAPLTLVSIQVPRLFGVTRGH